MEKSITNNSLWDKAGKAGLVLGLVSVAYLAITQFMPSSAESFGGGALLSLANLVLWGAKFYACIYLMKLFMKKYADETPDVMNSDTFKFGVVTAVLSALIYSAFYLAYATLINPDMFTEAIEVAKESYGSIMTSEALDALENMNFTTLSFFSNFIYCTLFGTVLSAILSRNIPSRDPFADDKANDDDE